MKIENIDFSSAIRLVELLRYAREGRSTSKDKKEVKRHMKNLNKNAKRFICALNGSRAQGSQSSR